jgi:hypothetical protein
MVSKSLQMFLPYWSRGLLSVCDVPTEPEMLPGKGAVTVHPTPNLPEKAMPYFYGLGASGGETCWHPGQVAFRG